MSNYENGRFIIESDTHEKTINLTNNYTNQIVVKLSPVNKNINVYLSDVQNNNEGKDIKDIEKVKRKVVRLNQKNFHKTNIIVINANTRHILVKVFIFLKIPIVFLKIVFTDRIYVLL